MHVLRRVFKQAVASVVVLDVVEGDGLEAAPAKRQDEGVSRLQDAVIPAVFLQPHLTCTQIQMLASFCRNLRTTV